MKNLTTILLAFTFALSCLFLTACATPQPLSSVSNQQCVVLVHGLWRDAYAMQPIANSLRAAGYYTVSLNYASTEKSAEQVAAHDMPTAIEQCRNLGSGPTHIVAHSLGGIVTRYYLQDHRLPGNGRVVMLSPPNKGSHLITRFADQKWLGWVVGSAVHTLNRNQIEVAQLEPIREQVGIIAGNRSRTLLPASVLPQPNDGTVALESTPLQEMTDYIVVEETHVSIRRAESVHEQIRHFLKSGRFAQTI